MGSGLSVIADSSFVANKADCCGNWARATIYLSRMTGALIVIGSNSIDNVTNGRGMNDYSIVDSSRTINGVGSESPSWGASSVPTTLAEVIGSPSHLAAGAICVIDSTFYTLRIATKNPSGCFSKTHT
jgi:hypothetical protein